MNIPSLRLLASALALGLALSSASFAQSPNAAVRLTPTVGANAAQSKATLTAKWNDTTQTFIVEFRNDSNSLLRIDGIQTSNGLYVVDFPKNVPKKGSADITLIYAPQPGVSSTVDIVKLLTDQGEKVVQVVHSREIVARFDTQQLTWAAGDARVGKSAIITVTANTAVPTGVRALGPGNYAVLEPLGNGSYRVTVTPGSTAKAGHFPVFVDFNPALPGVAPVIACDITAKN